MSAIIGVAITEEDIIEHLREAGLGDAIGETPINERLAIALARGFAYDIEAKVREYAEDLIGRLADKHARVDRLPE